MEFRGRARQAARTAIRGDCASGASRLPGVSPGFTLIEMAIAVALVATLVALGVPSYIRARDSAKVVRTIVDIKTIQDDVLIYEADHDGLLPVSLAEIGRDRLRDSWGNAYEYLSFATVHGTGKMRKDRFLVPLNTTFDLYSMGKDGKTATPLTSKNSRDDILRANDGGFIGLASDF